MEIIRYPDMADVERILQRSAQSVEHLRDSAMEVISNVCKEGDTALLRYTLQFDNVMVDSFVVSNAEFDEAEALTPPDLKSAIESASKNIRTFHEAQRQKPEKITTMPGVTCWRKSVGIERVGLYVPGGSAPLFSTVLMLGIPAMLAGCGRVALCTPPNKNGKVHPAILYAAKRVGITEVYKVGGMQAIAALAFGTQSIPRVDKILGPGNAYVTAAKQLVSNMGVAIDMPAGPSEVMVLIDGSSNPEFAAADLLSQAEHGADSQATLVSDNISTICKTLKIMQQQLQTLPRKDVAAQSLEKSKALLVKNEDEMVCVANTYAAEHLIIATKNAEQLAEKIVNAGSVFIGLYSPESVGDYASGTNHALPTAGYARAFSGVSVDSFVKKITFQSLTQDGVKNIGNIVEIMAEAEGLQAHKNAIRLRMKK
ncbi:MAG: histidinol dehydrogenase [Prevotellaceae bacterium]|jgi:histidinol dehydrogenase|nr:histidinol dehydrogenase [Prevotellaceae bacterium]